MKNKKAEDLKVIKRLEKQIGMELIQKDHNGCWPDRGYTIDENGNVFGLNLYHTEISCLKEFTHLTVLSLYDNQISDISPLKELTNLSVLRLCDNKISDISAINLKELTHLTTLDLRNNKISHLPREIVDLNMEILWYDDFSDVISLYGNPLESPPVEIVKQGREAVLNYFVKAIECPAADKKYV